MVLPGTVLGFTNLLSISAHHGFAGLSDAWIQAHGFSQVFGWIGSFVLGIGFYSQPKTRANRGSLPFVCWALWTAGLTLHWLFVQAARQHRLPEAAATLPGSAARRRVGCYGSRINSTPNIDRIGREGMRFQQAFCTNALCTPARASILTGQYSNKNGIYTLDDRFVAGQETFATPLQEAGYYDSAMLSSHSVSSRLCTARPCRSAP